MLKIRFQARKQPITSVHLTFDKKKGICVGWEEKDIGKSARIKDTEKGVFLTETRDFIYNIGLSGIVIKNKLSNIVNSSYKRKYSINNEEYNSSSSIAYFGLLALITEYWGKWGSLFPIEENRITFHELQYHCLAGILWIDLWNAIDEESCSTLTRSIIDDLFEKRQFVKEPLDYWSMCVYSESGRIRWKNTSKKEFVDKPETPWIFVQHPEKVPHKEKFKWFKREIGKNILSYYNRQGEQYSPEIIGNTLSFKVETRNKFLIWVLESIKDGEAQKTNLCFCGCGQQLDGKKEYWATPACKDRIKNQKPENKIKAWLRTRKNRGQLTEEEYEKYCVDIMRYLKKEYSEQQIRKTIEEKLARKN